MCMIYQLKAVAVNLRMCTVPLPDHQGDTASTEIINLFFFYPLNQQLQIQQGFPSAAELICKNFSREIRAGVTWKLLLDQYIEYSRKVHTESILNHERLLQV